VQLAAQLALPEPTLLARTGWTAADLQAAVDATALGPGQFALVSVMVGVNDQIRGSGNLGNARPATEPFRVGIASLLERAVSLAVGSDPRRVVVLSIPDWTCTPAGLKRSIAVHDSGLSATVVERQIDSYNSVLRGAAEAAGTRWVDVTPISRDGLVREGLVCDDGLHPSAKQYGEWVEAALPEIRAALSAVAGDPKPSG